jgi:hypothetical protein
MVEEELSAIEQNPEDKQALKQIEKLQEPILKRLSQSIHPPHKNSKVRHRVISGDPHRRLELSK